VGRLVFFRVYSGKIDAGQSVYNSSNNFHERIGRILQMHANKRENVLVAHVGEIACAIGLKRTVTGDTICDAKHPIILEGITFPKPVIRVAIEPKTKADQKSLSESLKQLSSEDPTFRIKQDTETGQTIIAGMGELHLEILVDRLLREFKVAANVGKPQVAYKETITKSVTSEGRFVRQSGGRGHYGHVVLELSPGEQGSGLVFESRIVGGVIPREFIPAVHKGIAEARNTGVIGAFPMENIQVALVDGSYHEVDSSDLSFKIAASIAFKDGVKRAGPILLEPMMERNFSITFRSTMIISWSSSWMVKRYPWIFL
jgi:Translation elongation factors (GTPases)